MPKTRKRQSRALERLKSDFPGIHADLICGRIPSLKKALVRAGLAHKPDPLDKLLKTWGKADARQREQFLTKIGVRAASSDTAVAMAEGHGPLIANGRYLLPQTIRRIEAIMTRRKLLPADVMAEIGFPLDSRSLTRALAKKASLRLAIIAALETWLQQQDQPG
ncbi:hypothetical protein ACQKKX_16190 [Neorhizobium sp. NPDC001467]|uniref:hypothetical protein n=1 Tax=Neorhizobium sp. NPDC001467 TaxID=3390595 RepID=UPI003CFEBF2B